MGEVVRVGMLGCGNVGAAVARMLHDHAEDVARRAGAAIEVSRVAVRDPAKPRDVPVDAARFTSDAGDIAIDPDVDVVVEVIGGVEPARTLLLAAMAAGKSVVTANKELLSTHGGELFDAAVTAGVDVLYEASVGGGIPLIRPIREHLAGDRVLKLTGILNGTTNYVLTRMAEDGSSLDDAIAEAQQLGYAEADPAADLDGHDAAAKAAILATIAFDIPVSASDVHREGIASLSADDIGFARRLGYVLKPVAVAEAVGGGVSVQVHPAMLPREHPLASVRLSFNAVLIEGERVGPLMLYGLGAGGDPTATSVVGDLIELARARAAAGAITHVGHASHGRGGAGAPDRPRRIVSIEELTARSYVLLEVADRSGVLATIAQCFAAHDVSIGQVLQEGRGGDALLVLITHAAPEASLQACFDDLRALESVRSVRSTVRVEESEP
ncbi:MAG TPA: homoserine dehydrogenase [Actinomycetota bacterium]